MLVQLFFFVVSKDILNKQILPSTEKPPNTDSKLDSSLQVMYDGGKSGIHDSFMQSPSYLGVVEAIPLVRSSLGSLSYEEELTVCFVKEPNSIEESALSFHLSRRLTITNAAFTIINGLTISFVSDANDNIILMDSHLHLQKAPTNKLDFDIKPYQKRNSFLPTYPDTFQDPKTR